MGIRATPSLRGPSDQWSHAHDRGEGLRNSVICIEYEAPRLLLPALRKLLTVESIKRPEDVCRLLPVKPIEMKECRIQLGAQKVPSVVFPLKGWTSVAKFLCERLHV